MESVGPSANWRDADTYAPLLAADRSIIAWEWLRRDPRYRGEAQAALAGSEFAKAADARSWGLVTFEDPDRTVPLARPLWTREVDCGVLEAIAGPSGREADDFDLARLLSLATFVRSSEGPEHVLLSDGFRAIRVDLLKGSIASGPTQLHYRLAGIASAQRPLLTLQRLLSLCRTGRFSRSLHRPESRARRWLLMLRAHDALAAGASQREIAQLLLSRAANAPRWRTESSSLRSQVQRLVHRARRMADGDYRALLAGR